MAGHTCTCVELTHLALSSRIKSHQNLVLIVYSCLRLGYKASVHCLYLCLFSIVSLEINRGTRLLTLRNLRYVATRLLSFRICCLSLFLTALAVYEQHEGPKVNQLTTDDVPVYVRQGEWRRPRMAYIYVTDLPSIFFICSSCTERTRGSFSPLGTIPCMFGYKYGTKPWPPPPYARADASKLESDVAVDLTMLALDNPVDGASKICFQTTTVAIGGLMVSLKVM